MGKMFNIPQHKLPAKMLANRAVLAAKTGRPGVIAEAIANANAHLNDVGLASYDETREALVDLLELLEENSLLEPTDARWYRLDRAREVLEKT